MSTWLITETPIDAPIASWILEADIVGVKMTATVRIERLTSGVEIVRATFRANAPIANERKATLLESGQSAACLAHVYDVLADNDSDHDNEARIRFNDIEQGRFSAWVEVRGPIGMAALCVVGFFGNDAMEAIL